MTLKGSIKRLGKLILNPVEYFDPTQGLEIEPYLQDENLYGIHHLGRYHWARMVLEDYNPKNILDIACGAGYGSFILATAFNEARVLGADYDKRALRVARQRYHAPNLQFAWGDMTTWEISIDGRKQSLGKYDAVVSFETIEHLTHREIALLRLTENLTDDGVFVLSTPCGHETSRLSPDQPHHKIEYCYHDLKQLLRRYFKTVLVPEEGTLPDLDYFTNVINKDKERYRNLANPVMCLKPIRV